MAEYDYAHQQDSPQLRARDVRAGIERRLASLEGDSLPQLAQCNGPLQLHAELAEALRQDIHLVESMLEDLSLIAEEAGTDSLRASILEAADLLSARLSRLRVRAREETLKSKRRIDSSTASAQRDALLGPAAGDRSTPRTATPVAGTSKDDELMSATANVTDGLRRTRQLLEQELERSSLSTQMLERSSQTLALTSDQYTSFSGLLNASKTIITTMQKADTLDRLLILAALLFFGLVCILIIKRRIIDRGIRAATLFSRLAGAGSKPVQQKIVPSALRSTVSQKQDLKEAVTTISNVLQEATSTVASVTSAAIASASLASTGIASSASAAQQPPHSPASLSLSTDLELASSDVEATQTTIAVSESPGVDAQERAFDEALFERVQAKQGEDHQAEGKAAVEGTESTLPLTEELEGISAQIEHIIDEL